MNQHTSSAPDSSRDTAASLEFYQPEGQPVEVRLAGETVWLTQRQMAGVFGTTPENVLMHLRNIFNDQELDESATAKDFLAVRAEGKRQVQRNLKHYNLDAIISVGFLVGIPPRAPGSHLVGQDFELHHGFMFGTM